MSYNLRRAEKNYLRLVSSDLKHRLSFDGTVRSGRRFYIALHEQGGAHITSVVYQEDLPEIRVFLDEFEESCRRQQSRVRTSKGKGASK